MPEYLLNCHNNYLTVEISLSGSKEDCLYYGRSLVRLAFKYGLAPDLIEGTSNTYRWYSHTYCDSGTYKLDITTEASDEWQARARAKSTISQLFRRRLPMRAVEEDWQGNSEYWLRYYE